MIHSRVLTVNDRAANIHEKDISIEKRLIQRALEAPTPYGT